MKKTGLEPVFLFLPFSPSEARSELRAFISQRS